MALVLQQILDRSELTKLPKPIQTKLEKFLGEQQQEIDSMKFRYEKFKVDSEQQSFEVEKRLAFAQQKLVTETQECQHLCQELDKLGEECKQLGEEKKQFITAQENFTLTEEELSTLRSQTEELQKHNSLLHEQIESLGSKMVTSVQEVHRTPVSPNVYFTEEGKLQEQIMEILRFVCREKEIAETRYEVAQVESLRYQQKVAQLERDLKEVQESLNIEREKIQVGLSNNTLIHKAPPSPAQV